MYWSRNDKRTTCTTTKTSRTICRNDLYNNPMGYEDVNLNQIPRVNLDNFPPRPMAGRMIRQHAVLELPLDVVRDEALPGMQILSEDEVFNSRRAAELGGKRCQSVNCGKAGPDLSHGRTESLHDHAPNAVPENKSNVYKITSRDRLV